MWQSEENLSLENHSEQVFPNHKNQGHIMPEVLPEGNLRAFDVYMVTVYDLHISILRLYI